MHSHPVDDDHPSARGQLVLLIEDERSIAGLIVIHGALLLSTPTCAPGWRGSPYRSRCTIARRSPEIGIIAGWSAAILGLTF